MYNIKYSALHKTHRPLSSLGGLVLLVLLTNYRKSAIDNVGGFALLTNLVRQS